MAENNKQSPAELLAQIAELQAKLQHSESKRTEAESMAAALAEATAFGGSAEEQATGKTIKQRQCANPWERDEKKQKWVDVEVPTFFYTVDLPASAGASLLTNGIEYYHAQTYEVDQATLVDLKSRVARCWDHERSIHSGNEADFKRHMDMRTKAMFGRHA